MGLLVIGVIIGLAGLAVPLFIPAIKHLRSLIALGLIIFGGLVAIAGGVAYNDAGYCQHIRNVFGKESSTCNTGWYFLGWGTSTQWPHFITVSHTTDPDADGSSVSGPYPVRLADNWNGDVTQTTRFGIPQDNDQFIRMARDFRSPERLITTTLRPAVTSSLDSISNLFTMEEYYAGGLRDQYKTEFRNAVIKGRARVRQITNFVNNVVTQPGARPNALDTTDEGDTVGDTGSRRIIMEKVLDADGNEIREAHGYTRYGIVVSSAILENLDPDDLFEQQIQARKDAASRRIVAQEERREQEEQRLLAIQRGQTEIAKRQAEAEVEQIQQTTEAETRRQLANIAATQVREEAEIARETSEINLERAKIDAETQRTLADAEAYQRRVILEADNALQAKLDALVKINAEWASAAATINVPHTVFAMGDGEGTTGNFASVEAFMTMMIANAANQLNVDATIEKRSVR